MGGKCYGEKKHGDATRSEKIFPAQHRSVHAGRQFLRQRYQATHRVHGVEILILTAQNVVDLAHLLTNACVSEETPNTVFQEPLSAITAHCQQNASTSSYQQTKELIALSCNTAALCGAPSTTTTFGKQAPVC